MTRKIITGVIAAILLATIGVFAAEKAKEKALAEKPELKAQAGEQQALSKVEGQEQHEGLLDQLVAAYKANDRGKMGEILVKMQERRGEMQEHAKFNRWHKEAHRQMMGQMGSGFAPNGGAMQGWQGQQMAGQGSNQGCTINSSCGNCCCAMRGQGQNQGGQMAGPQCGQFQPMMGRGFGGCNNMMGNCGATAGPQNEVTMGWGCGPGIFNGMGNSGPMPGRNFGQMPCQQGGMGMSNCMPQQGGQGQMAGCGRGSQKDCAQGTNAGDKDSRGCNMPRNERQTNVPPAEWGW